MKNYTDLENRPDILEAALREFYKEMNRNAIALKMRDSHFYSAHGMDNDQNYSSA